MNHFPAFWYFFSLILDSLTLKIHLFSLSQKCNFHALVVVVKMGGLNGQSLCSKKLSGKGGYGQNLLSSFWKVPLHTTGKETSRLWMVYIAALYFSVNWMVRYEWHGSSNWVSNWALYHILDKMSLLETNCVQSQTAAPLDHHQHSNQRQNSTSTDNKATWCYLGGAS